MLKGQAFSARRNPAFGKKLASQQSAHSLQDFDAIFSKIKSRFPVTGPDALICKQGYYKGCFVLKLQKAAWTNDSMYRVQNESGIFFSVWIEKKTAGENRANYNIHALKLRNLHGYALTSRAFAEAFRNSIAFVRDDWPNVRTDYGPQTLMQGWIEFESGDSEAEIRGLMERFVKLSPVIDRLLEARRK